ncbi:DUF423 domain-containing protein [Candidatus Contendibacter odensensis]|uniref:DUF423 domain-containing protein n=1 Tax=Candidatus Contendobacter odensis Run_B_J11 TaxID=1400861 RepID=A0A7U7J2Z6_9GAMM|nr:DUF423 domain-containing protein [Candidatus Contendobacter odensis]CDH43822.1 conserved membrane hypothetical protein [Candidatus Contendobacter odensis Run_B_J11]
MPILAKTFLFLGSVGMLLAVALGAFGAHALKKTLAPDLMAVYETAVNYHVYHALGLLAVGLLALHIPESALLRWAGILLAVGVLLFSGSLYTLSLSGIRWLGAITPLGGIAFLIAWLLLVIAVVRAD